MKIFFTLLAALVLAMAGNLLQSQTLDWGSEVFSDLVDSDGDVLDSTFVFELGAFADGFTPDESNVDEWVTNWRVFHRAAYNEAAGYFSSSVNMLDDGTSDSPHLTSGAPSFEGLNAYLWVRNGDDPVEGTEWLLTRSDTWVFPAAIPGCCDNGTPLQWSVSDLDGGDVPEWGKQGSVGGPGVFTDPGTHTLQTYTFVPESSSLAMAGLAAVLLLRRHRNQRGSA